jgi:hypothetical protein
MNETNTSSYMSRFNDNYSTIGGLPPTLGVSAYASMPPNVKKQPMMPKMGFARPNMCGDRAWVWNDLYNTPEFTDNNYTPGCFNNYPTISHNYMNTVDPKKIIINPPCDVFKNKN